MDKLIKILNEGNYSCVVENLDGIQTFNQRGVADLYDMVKNKPHFLKDAKVADKVVGKGAAALMILGGVKELYTDIISTPALNLLHQSGIKIDFGKEVPFIENRTKTDWCPVEKLCSQAQSADACLPLIEEFITKMKANQ